MDQQIRLAVVGLGQRAFSLIQVFKNIHSNFQLVAVVDPDKERAQAKVYDLEFDPNTVDIFDSVDRLLEYSDRIDGILIGSPCNLHTPIALKLASSNVPIYLEKPVAISKEQVRDLKNAYAGREKEIVVSFPMRVTPLFSAVMEIVNTGRLGVINQVQAVNYVPYGGCYYARPAYRDANITGGMWLQKATHDFDYINALLGKPISVSATSSRKIYGGDMPNSLQCSECSISENCLESPSGVAKRGDDGGVGIGDHLCVFGKDIHLQDAGAALLTYENGVHACYTQNFVSRRSAAARGATITGYKATLSFDWYTENVKVIEHHSDRVDQFTVKASTGHLGGDEELARNFTDVCLGRAESRTDLTDGLLSASMCIAATESVNEKNWMQIA